MAESVVEGGEERTEKEEAEEAERWTMSRKERRKDKKKAKRKQIRKEAAEKERREEERRLNDPEEQRRAKELEEEEAERMERDRKLFEERERMWLEEMARKQQQEEEVEEEERRKLLEEEAAAEAANKLQNECDEDDDWEYIEEGPAEIIWQGNEIIVRKKKIRVPKKSREEVADRPTSNPLPPQSEAFAEYQNASVVSAQQMLENVAQQVPNFGTEQDKAHCPFHLKTGACRFGQRCSRVHFYPDKSCTLLIKNMCNGPGLAWDQDEGLEYTDEEVELSYEEFYEDVHTEFLKYGEILNFKVCKNGSPHLRGNVYVQYQSLDSAVLAFHSINGRYFAGKQVNCEYVNVTRWKVAICGEYMKSRLKTCSRGTACNFIHCFRNPGGDYEWADWDKPPPRYWVKKMAALFGYSDEYIHEKQEQGKPRHRRTSSKTISADRNRYHSRRSRSMDMDHSVHFCGKSSDEEDGVQHDTRSETFRADDRTHKKTLDERFCEDNRNTIEYHHNESRSHDSNSDGGCLDREVKIEKEKHGHHGHAKNRSKHHREVSASSTDHGESRNKTYGADSDEEWLGRGRNEQKHCNHTKKSGHQTKGAFLEDNRENNIGSPGADEYQFDGDRENKNHDSHKRKSSRHHRKLRSLDDCSNGKSKTLDTGSTQEWSHRDKGRYRHHYHARKSSGHRSNVSEFPDDNCADKDRTDGANYCDDQINTKERYHSHRRKRAKHPEFADDGERESELGKPSLKRNSRGSHSSRRFRLSTESGANSRTENLTDEENHESSLVDQYDADVNLGYNFFGEIDDDDRWDPVSP